MKRFQDILITDISKFDVEEWDGKLLFHNYERLKSYISANFGTDSFDFFSRPKTGRQNEIIWQSNIFEQTPVQLSSLKDEDYNHYVSILNKNLQSFRQIITHIEQSGKNKDWAKLLSKAIIYGGNDFVFCSEDKISIVAWSMKPKPVVPEKYIDYSPEQKISSTLLSPTPEIKNLTAENENNELNAEDKIWESRDKQSTLTPPFNASLEEDNNLTVESDSPPFVSSNSNDNRETENVKTNSVNGVAEEGKTKKTWWKWLLYLLLALLVLLILFLLFRSCNGMQGDIGNEDGRKLLPDIPALPVPIEEPDIEYSDDSLTRVVSNRLNILLKSENLYDFAVDFKKQYPGDNYQIIYYDTIIRRLQLVVPKEEKRMIRTELKQKLSQYDFIIWDESLFENNYTPNDPAILNRRESWYIDAIKAFGAWDKTQGNQDIIVAVIDDGFDLNHPELREHIYKPYNVYTKNDRVTSAINRKHGTHVAGLAIAMNDNREGISGIAPHCRFMPVQVAHDFTGIMSSTAIIDGVIYAIYNGADVINLSLGMQFGPILSLVPSYMQRDIINNNFKEEERVWNEIFRIAEEYNTTIVIAAGNENVMSGLDPMQRSNYCIKVSAVTPNIEKTTFSNYGEYSTISAPGVSIYSSVPGNRYEFMDGTSMAAPLVTGGVALIKSLDKTIPTRSIIQLLQKTGIPVRSQAPVGNLIQLDKALTAYQNEEIPTDNICENISFKIDSLMQVIEELKRQCPDYETPDTLKLPEVIENPQTLNGKWKSTSPLHNTDGEDIVVYFEFINGSGTLSLIEPDGQVCTAPIHVNINGNIMKIVQESEAGCGDGSNYAIYELTCEADENGNALCLAIRSDFRANRLMFNLIKIK
jgi:hypothetical protein